jgi:hypothetical protein
MSIAIDGINIPLDYLPSCVHTALNWNPFKFELTVRPFTPTPTLATARAMMELNLRSASAPSDLNVPLSNHRMSTSTRLPAFYDMHFGLCHVLKHLRLHESLDECLAGVVDRAIKDQYVSRKPLPSDPGELLSE